ncbi:uncharacterized protein LOC135816106 [Sycon ciliatum]|uniref:uncharacterized protein LOC135816106 n=1 Tax=Sycon ciliatum TaxID=27933 RepID=UPI0031F6A0C3
MEETIYASYGSVKDRRDSKLVRSDDLAKTWEVILPRLQHFLVSSKFVFASIVRKGTQSIRDLVVSERSGKVNSCSRHGSRLLSLQGLITSWIHMTRWHLFTGIWPVKAWVPCMRLIHRE